MNLPTPKHLVLAALALVGLVLIALGAVAVIDVSAYARTLTVSDDAQVLAFALVLSAITVSPALSGVEGALKRIASALERGAK